MTDRATRLLKIYSRLRRGPVTIETLTKWASKNGIEVSPRSLYRDFKEIEQLQLIDGETIVVTEGEKNRKIWKIEFSENQRHISEYDINSYALFKNFATLPVILQRTDSLLRIEELFYSIFSQSKFEMNATVIDSHFLSTHFNENLNIVADSLMEAMIWSIKNSRELTIKQLSFDHTSLPDSLSCPLVLLPLQLIYHRGEIHVAGVEKESLETVIMSIMQIGEYSLSNEMFQRQIYEQHFKKELKKRFRITSNIDRKVHHIKLEFSPLTGHFVKNHHWHPTEKWTESESGNPILHRHCGINRELVGWIFKWMRNVRVLEPKVLRDLVIAESKSVIEHYEDPKPLESVNVYRQKYLPPTDV